MLRVMVFYLAMLKARKISELCNKVIGWSYHSELKASCNPFTNIYISLVTIDLSRVMRLADDARITQI